MESISLGIPYINCLPNGYISRPDGIYQVTIGRDDEIQEDLLCSPFTVVAQVHDRFGTGWGRLVEFVDPAGHNQQWAILDSMVPNKVIAGLRHRGLQISCEPGASKAIMTLLRKWSPDRPHITTTDRLGWLDEKFQSFALGDGRILGGQNVKLDSRGMASAASAMAAHGSLSNWRGTVASLCVGNPLLVLSVSLAFTGPLLELLCQMGGGLHLRGFSSSGKSTIQIAAGSVWGSRDFACSWRATANGLEGLAAARNSTLLVLDEMGEASGKDVSAAAYMLPHGVGKQRASSSGSAQQVAKWCLAVLSSGEVTLAQKLADVGQKAMAGQEIRLIDIVADNRRHGAFDDLHGESGGQHFADKLNHAATLNHGLAGPEFVRFVLQHRNKVVPILRSLMVIYDARLKAEFGQPNSGFVARAMTQFALIAAAGTLATKFNITGWPESLAINAARVLFGEWLDAQEVVDQTEIDEAIERTRTYLVKYGRERFECAGLAPVGKRAGFANIEYFYIDADAWREIHHGHDCKQAALHLHSAGLLTRGEGNNIQRKTPLTLNGRSRGYAVRSEIIGHRPDSSVLPDPVSDKPDSVGYLGLAA